MCWNQRPEWSASGSIRLLLAVRRLVAAQRTVVRLNLLGALLQSVRVPPSGRRQTVDKLGALKQVGYPPAPVISLKSVI